MPLTITWREVEPSAAIEAAIREHVTKLEAFHAHIVGCRVVVEPPQGHHHKGNLYRIHIDIRVPGREIVVTRDPTAHQAHQDFYVAMRDAFDAARRQLQDYARQRRGDVKHHD